MTLHKQHGRKAVILIATPVAIVITVAAAAFACTNYVGRMAVRGDRSGSGTVTVTGNQPANDPSEAMTQSVSSGIADALKAQNSSGNFEVWAGPRTDNGWKLDAGTYDLNFFDGGSTTDGYAYTNHTTWNNPTGDCMTWNVPVVQVTKLGTVTIDSSGNISGGAGTYYISTTSNWAKFKWPVANAKVSSSPKESGVCISESNSQDGNQAPIRVFTS